MPSCGFWQLQRKEAWQLITKESRPEETKKGDVRHSITCPAAAPRTPILAVKYSKAYKTRNRQLHVKRKLIIKARVYYMLIKGLAWFKIKCSSPLSLKHPLKIESENFSYKDCNPATLHLLIELLVYKLKYSVYFTMVNMCT